MMRARSSWPIIAGCALVLGVAYAQAATDPRGDRLEEYLASLELDTLLAEYLEGELSGAGNESGRLRIGERLARVYARLLENVSGEASVRRWESASEALLRDVPDLDSLELRLALAQASYQRAERDIERYRLELNRSLDPDALEKRFADLLERLEALAKRSDLLVQGLERREEDRMLPAQRRLVDDALAQARRHSSQANYLSGFSGRYLSTLSGDSEGARAGLDHFGALLDAPQGEDPDFDRIPSASVRYPHIARSIIGTALCYSLTGRVDQGLRWLDELEGHEQCPRDLGAAIFAARVEIFSSERRWEDLLAAVTARRETLEAREGVTALPTLEARLVAVVTLRAVTPGRTVPALATARDVALSDLLARGEFGHAVDLASIFGGERFGVETFVSQQVRALMIYERARVEHERSGGDASEPVEDPELARAYLDAAELFERALGTEDAFVYPDAMSSAAALVGLCRYYAGALSGSSGSEWFVRAADKASDPERAAEALWMAILAMDAEIEAQGEEIDPEKRGERDRLIERFLADYPEHPRADMLLLRQIASGNIPPGRAVELLLAIPETSSMYDAARREAARLEFLQFRRADRDRRSWHARRFIELATPLLATHERRAREGDTESAVRAGDFARRLLEASLGMEPADLNRAVRVLEVGDALWQDGLVEGDAFAEELEYRRAQILLIEGDREGARAAMDRLASGDSRFVEAGERLFYREALSRWSRLRRVDPVAEGSMDAARDVVRHGGRLFLMYTEEDGAIGDPAVRSLGRTVADAALDVHLATGDRAWAERAYALYTTLRSGGDRDADLLRSLGVVSELLGKEEEALESWRTLVAGLTPGSDAWFAARVEHLRLLSVLDPVRAREVMSQHRALYPDLGPEPHKSRLEAIEESLSGGDGP